jgi:hypothetical protein
MHDRYPLKQLESELKYMAAFDSSDTKRLLARIIIGNKLWHESFATKYNTF